MHDLFSKRGLKGIGAYLLLIVAAAALSACVTARDDGARQAEQRLREYFDFPRLPLEDRGYAGLFPPDRILKATPEYPAVIFASRNDLESGAPPGCEGYPVILMSSGTEWWTIETGLLAWNWDDVWTTPDRSRIWAVLSADCGIMGGGVLLLFSADGGWTWRTLFRVDQNHYCDLYTTLVMTSYGEGTLAVDWGFGEWGSFYADCEHSEYERIGRAVRWLYRFRTKDWGATWKDSTGVRGIVVRPMMERDDADVGPLEESEYVNLDLVREWFPEMPVAIDPASLPGAVSLAFDEGLLRRAKAVSGAWTFLEAAEEKQSGLESPYLFGRGGKDGKEPPFLIRLPHAGYRWRACGGHGNTVGILQPAGRAPGETWVVQCLNEGGQWTAGRLPDLPAEPYCFDSLWRYKCGRLELHVRLLPKEGDSREPGRYVYESVDGGRSWATSRFEPDILQPVKCECPPFGCFPLSEGVEKTLTDAMAGALAGIPERPTRPLETPTIPELVELLRKTEWYMPCTGTPLHDPEGRLDGEPALHFAVTYEKGLVDLLKALLDAGADLHAQDGYTALDYAVQMNAREAIAFLRDQKTSWGGTDEYGCTSLHWLFTSTDPDWVSGWGGLPAWQGSPEEITQRAIEHAEFLLDHGADVNAKDEWGNTVLEEAIEHNAAPELIQLLIKHGAIQEIEAENAK